MSSTTSGGASQPDRVAVVTGGGNGIGRASALRLSTDGCAVVVADIQKEKADAVVDEIRAAGGQAVGCALEATSRVDNDAMAQLAVSEFGRLDVLLTAAGISHGSYRSGDFENDMKRMMANVEFAERQDLLFIQTELEDWNRVLEVNLTGTFLAMQACASRMIDLGNGGSIITIASIAAKDPDAGPLAYTSSKAGVWMLTKKSARMLAVAGIRVNSIGPGFIDTNMTELIKHAPADRLEQLKARIPLARTGQPSEVASVVSFLASDDASYMTGTLLHPHGGWFTD